MAVLKLIVTSLRLRQIQDAKVGWFAVLEFNATLTAKVISWRSVTHMCFLAFSHQYYFLSKATDYFSRMFHAEIGGENTPERKFASTGYRTQSHQGHESDTFSTEPPGRGKMQKY